MYSQELTLVPTLGKNHLLPEPGSFLYIKNRHGDYRYSTEGSTECIFTEELTDV